MSHSFTNGSTAWIGHCTNIRHPGPVPGIRSRLDKMGACVLAWLWIRIIRSDRLVPQHRLLRMGPRLAQVQHRQGGGPDLVQHRAGRGGRFPRSERSRKDDHAKDALRLHIGIANEMQYRVNFFIQLLQSFIALGTGLIGLWLEFSHIPNWAAGRNLNYWLWWAYTC